MRTPLLLLALAGCEPASVDDTGSDTLDTSDGGDGPDTDTDTDTQASVPVLHINEFMASNASFSFEDDKSTPDWIEIYNPGDAAVSLEGFTITDDLEEPGKHVLSGLSVPAGGFLLLYADGEPGLGAKHLDFKLSSKKESIGLYTPGGEPIDRLSFTDQATDLSAARVPDGGELQIVSEPTPGESNGSR